MPDRVSAAPRNRVTIVALVFAGIALMFAVTPGISGFTFLFAYAAMVLAIIGITRRETRRLLATIALVIGLLTIPISGVVFTWNVLDGADDPSLKVPGGVEGL